MEIKLESTYKGTRMLFGDTAKRKRLLLNDMIECLNKREFQEIMIPIIQSQDTFKSKVGEENQNMMFNFKDRGNRDLCLAPEYTAIVQKLAKERFKFDKDVTMFYIAECFRGEKPQAGRLRQFTQLGVEILNPTQDYSQFLVDLAVELLDLNCVSKTRKPWIVNEETTRGLDYYTGGKGFEISLDELGAQKQLVGGGSYDGGIGFAIGIDRLLLIKES